MILLTPHVLFLIAMDRISEVMYPKILYFWFRPLKKLWEEIMSEPNSPSKKINVFTASAAKRHSGVSWYDWLHVGRFSSGLNRKKHCRFVFIVCAEYNMVYQYYAIESLAIFSCNPKWSDSRSNPIRIDPIWRTLTPPIVPHPENVFLFSSYYFCVLLSHNNHFDCEKVLE